MRTRNRIALGAGVCLAAVVTLCPSAALAGSSRGKVLIVNTGAGTVTVIDTAKKVVLGNPPVGNHPTKLVTDKRGRLAYVINPGSDDLSVINLQTLAVLDVPLGFEPSDLAITPNGTTVVILHAEPDVASGGSQFQGDYTIYDAKKGGVVRTNRLNGLGSSTHDPCGVQADNSSDAVWILDCATSKVVLIDLRKARENDSGDEVRAVLDPQTGPSFIAITSR
jgi:YVTN family beta-propeller protein